MARAAARASARSSGDRCGARPASGAPVSVPDSAGGGEGLGENGWPLLRWQVRRQAGQHLGAKPLVPYGARGG
jgi:hypothetical protein